MVLNYLAHRPLGFQPGRKGPGVVGAVRLHLHWWSNGANRFQLCTDTCIFTVPLSTTAKCSVCFVLCAITVTSVADVPHKAH